MLKSRVDREFSAQQITTVNRPILIAPSILAANFGHLNREVSAVAQAGADLIHFDVMDGRFVPEITVGPQVLAALRAHVTLPLDVHLMVEEPERQIQSFAQAGADIITVHLEASRHLHRTVQAIKALGKQAGVSLNPHSPALLLEPILADLDLVLVMSVNPGYGGQRFIPAALEKIRALRRMIDERGLATRIEVDGGVAPGTAGQAIAAGADILVAGTAVFGKPDYAKAIEALRNDTLQFA